MLTIYPLPHSPARKIGKYTMLKKSGDVQNLSALSTQKIKNGLFQTIHLTKNWDALIKNIPTSTIY